MIRIENITLRVAGRALLQGAGATIPDGAKVGLIGRNGTGKTSLFRAICGDIPTEAGEIAVPKGQRIGQVAQEAPGTDQPLIDIVLAADTERADLLRRSEIETDPQAIADIHTRLADIDAWSGEARAATILSGLGFSEAEQHQPASAFSGGWRMRVALAALLFSRPDIMLLDEPTNYLDLEGTLWLEQFVARYPGTVLIISHDRDLLNVAVDSVLHLENRGLTFYRGNYDGFARQRADRIELQRKAAEKQAARAKHLQSFVDRFRAKASKARQAQSRIKMLEKMQPVAMFGAEASTPIRFPEPDKLLSSPIIRLEGASAGYAPDSPVLRNLSLRIDQDDRIALLGANGNGKSTFAKLLANRLTHVDGTITRAAGLKVAMFAQHQLDDLVAEQTPVDHVRAKLPDLPEAKVRARVSQMGLDTQRMDTKAKSLSGGEKARLLLGLATLGGPHLIILDEPTNHLDMDARESLMMALNDFGGAVILVSHDRHLVEACSDRLWLVANNCVTAFDGDMADYRSLILGRSRSGRDEPAKPAGEPAPATGGRQGASARRQQLQPLQKRISETERAMEKLRDGIAKIDAKLADPGFFSRNPEKGAEYAKMRAEAEKRLARAEEAWLALNEEYEQAAG